MSATGNAESYIELKGSLSLPDSIKGKSAYEIAVAHGFDGTEEEWLLHLERAQAEEVEEAAEQAKTDISEAKKKMLSEIELAAEIVQTSGDSETAVMSQKATTEAIALERKNRETAVQTEKERAEKRENEIEKLFSTPTQEAVNRWLNDHPEATTTVQDGSIGVEKFTDALKLSAVKDYVTPEMFGAVGDGVADDSGAIQSAIDTNMPCRLTGTYRIDNAIEIIKNNQFLIIDGELRVYGDVGIIVNGSYNVIGGDGTIKVVKRRGYGAPTTAIKILVDGGVQMYSNKIRVARIGNAYTDNDNIGVEIVGGATSTGACYDIIDSYIEWFRYGVWTHSANDQHADSWYTALTIDGTIAHCLRAVVMDWGGGGTNIRGQIQPVGKGHSSIPTNFDTSLSLVKMAASCKMEAYIWDTSLAINKYMIEVAGKNCIISTSTGRQYINIPLEFKPYTDIKENYATRQFGVATINNAEEHSMSVFDNTNDLLLNCHENPLVDAKWSKDGGVNYSDNFKTSYGSGFVRFFNGGNDSYRWSGLLSGTINSVEFIFNFAVPKTIRHIAMWGNALADYYKLEVATTDAPTTFKELATLTAGVDYVRRNDGGERCAAWHYNYADCYSIFGDYHERKIASLKIKMGFSDGNTYNMSRIAAFDVEADVMKRSGGAMRGDLIFPNGTGCVLTDGNGKKYRLTIGTDGTLSAVAL